VNELMKLSEIHDSKNKKIKALHVNIISMRKNWEELMLIFEETKIEWDIIVLTEINIKKYETILYRIKNYESCFLTRETTKRGGGICIFV